VCALFSVCCMHTGRADAQSQLDLAMNELRQKILVLQEIEKNSVRAALIEERSRYCLFISAIKPFMVCLIVTSPTMFTQFVVVCSVSQCWFTEFHQRKT